MSEWYENKTLKELDGKRVRVEYENGSVIEGVLHLVYDCYLQIFFDKDGENSRYVFSSTLDHGSKKFINDGEKITLLDDDDMTRIDDINDVRAGDIEVTKIGDHYEVTEVGDKYTTSESHLKALVPDVNCSLWLHDSAFAYALRPKPQLPTEPGLYMDTDSANRLWIRTWSKIDGVYWRSVQDNNGMPIADLYTDEKMLAELHGATLYPVEIKRVES